MKSSFLCAILALAAPELLAAELALCVEFTGPGGHSNGHFGRPSAVHAASHAVLAIDALAPDALLTNMQGGVSVNAIAASCRFEVHLKGDAESLVRGLAIVEAAARSSAHAENAFRGTADDDPMAVHVRVTELAR